MKDRSLQIRSPLVAGHFWRNRERKKVGCIHVFFVFLFFFSTPALTARSMAVTFGALFSRSLERAVAKNETSDLIGQEDKNDIEDETSH